MTTTNPNRLSALSPNLSLSRRFTCFAAGFRKAPCEPILAGISTEAKSEPGYFIQGDLRIAARHASLLTRGQEIASRLRYRESEPPDPLRTGIRKPQSDPAISQIFRSEYRRRSTSWKILWTRGKRSGSATTFLVWGSNIYPTGQCPPGS